MLIQDKLNELLNSNDGKVYLYISKHRENLDKIRQSSLENVDFTKTQTKVLLLFPLGLGFIRGKINGVYYDNDATTEGFVLDHVDLSENPFFQSINPETLEII